MDDLLAILLFAAPFVLIGATFGYLTRRGRTPPVAFPGSGIPLIALGIAGLASITDASATPISRCGPRRCTRSSVILSGHRVRAGYQRSAAKESGVGQTAVLVGSAR